MRLLIDECLHTSLTRVANDAGHEAQHVNWRGWSGFKDHQLLEIVLREEFLFVTNNARDFRKLMGGTEFHAGLVIIVPNVTPTLQRDLFERALIEVAKYADMVNRVIEVDSREYASMSCRNLDGQRSRKRGLERGETSRAFNFGKLVKNSAKMELKFDQPITPRDCHSGWNP